MSTQHPDNVTLPFFTLAEELGGEDEVEEAYYAFSHLGCDEQMWDCEGKEVDNFVVKKLLTKYQGFFGDHALGRDLFLTLRVPNPMVERAEAKVLLETLESIPRSFDAARAMNDLGGPPIFEVILPMTSSASSLDRIYWYYRDFVAGKQHSRLRNEATTIGDWVGHFQPEKINVIPLYEDLDNMLEAAEITRQFLNGKELEHQRVFLARSDPAMNYGMVAAVLLNKIALQRLDAMSRETGVPVYPIIGVGSAPFRGNLTPHTVDNVANEYPSAHTFTIQSAFKFDYPPDEVREAVLRLSARDSGPPQRIDEERAIDIIRRCARSYATHVTELAPVIRQVALHLPPRRRRRLHVGLFGYGRMLGDVPLPRAIAFTGALYSIGLPPELLALDPLTADDIDFLRSVYVNFDDDLRSALRYLNTGTGLVPDEVERALDRAGIGAEADDEHRAITTELAEAATGGTLDGSTDQIVHAAHLRRFLG